MPGAVVTSHSAEARWCLQTAEVSLGLYPRGCEPSCRRPPVPGAGAPPAGRDAPCPQKPCFLKTAALSFLSSSAPEGRLPHREREGRLRNWRPCPRSEGEPVTSPGKTLVEPRSPVFLPPAAGPLPRKEA